MRTPEIEKNVARHFRERNFVWKMKDDTTAIPTPADLEFMFDQLVARLDEEAKKPDGGNRIEVGRLVVIRDGAHTDLYVYFGEI